MDIEKMNVPELKVALKKQQAELLKVHNQIIESDKLTSEKISLKICQLSHRGIDILLSKLPPKNELEQEARQREILVENIQDKIKSLQTKQAAESSFKEFDSLIEQCEETKELLVSTLEKFNQMTTEVILAGKKTHHLIKKGGTELGVTESDCNKKIGQLQRVYMDLGLSGAINNSCRHGYDLTDHILQISIKRHINI